MLFTSFSFAFFLIIVFVFYWFVFNRNLATQNFFLLLSSYVFYGWWDWRFLFLLFFISFSNYLIAFQIQKKDQKSHRKLLLITGLTINIGTLAIFKYFNFFIDESIHLLSLFKLKLNLQTINIILPLGISFYIFLSLSYIIDVYQHKLKAVHDIFEGLLTFTFFPIILAGPIQRPISLLPQIQTKRIFNYTLATDGLRQILWGVFMKIVIADKCAAIVNTIFTDSHSYAGSTLTLGIFLFTVQIYADFAGYSNIAIGIGKLLGFKIMQNFAYPYFSRDIREFWKSWNISLTTWFRDYVFLPIAFWISRKIKSERFYLIKTEFLIYTIGISITWMLTGLWHGASYTFIFWGLIQGLFLIINHLMAKPRKRFLKRINLRSNNIVLIIADTLATFIIIMFSWVFFRSDSIADSFSYISEIFSNTLFTIPEVGSKITLLIVAGFFIIEWAGRTGEYAMAGIVSKLPKPARWAMYYSLILTVLWFSGENQQFIYFQF